MISPPQPQKRKAYPSDVSNEEWAFVAPYFTLIKEDSPQREYPLRELFNAVRWIVKTGAQWRMMPHDLPPWATVYQQMQRWIKWEVKVGTLTNALKR
jgi:transposase